MAIVPARLGNRFGALPNVIVTLVFKCLRGEDGRTPDPSDRTILATSQVCRSWRDSSALTAERQEAATRLRRPQIERQYPQEMRELFQNCNFPIERLPVERLDSSFFELFGSRRPTEIKQTVMRVQDCLGHPGIVLNIQTRATSTLVMRWRLSGRFEQIRSAVRRGDLFDFIRRCKWAIETLVEWEKCDEYAIIFYRNIFSASDALDMQDNPRLRSLYEYRQGHSDCRGCPACPFTQKGPSNAVIQDLLMGRDPDFKLTKGKRELSAKTILVTALAAVAIAYVIEQLYRGTELKL